MVTHPGHTRFSRPVGKMPDKYASSNMNFATIGGRFNGPKCSRTAKSFPVPHASQIVQSTLHKIIPDDHTFVSSTAINPLTLQRDTHDTSTQPLLRLDTTLLKDETPEFDADEQKHALTHSANYAATYASELSRPGSPLTDNDAEADQEDDEDDIPTAATAVSFKYSETDKVIEYLDSLLNGFQQAACKKFAKILIKKICPKKQARWSYAANKHAPFWPKDVIHREPDHLKREQRVKLLIHLCRLRPSPQDRCFWATRQDKPSEQVEAQFSTSWTDLVQSCMPLEMLNEVFPGDKRRIAKVTAMMDSFFDVLRKEEEVLNGERDADSVFNHWPDELEEKLVRGKRKADSESATDSITEKRPHKLAKKSASRTTCTPPLGRSIGMLDTACHLNRAAQLDHQQRSPGLIPDSASTSFSSFTSFSSNHDGVLSVADLDTAYPLQMQNPCLSLHGSGYLASNNDVGFESQFGFDNIEDMQSAAAATQLGCTHPAKAAYYRQPLMYPYNPTAALPAYPQHLANPRFQENMLVFPAQEVPQFLGHSPPAAGMPWSLSQPLIPRPRAATQQELMTAPASQDLAQPTYVSEQQISPMTVAPAQTTYLPINHAVHPLTYVPQTIGLAPPSYHPPEQQDRHSPPFYDPPTASPCPNLPSWENRPFTGHGSGVGGGQPT